MKKEYNRKVSQSSNKSKKKSKTKKTLLDNDTAIDKNIMDTTIKAGAYLRVSTDEQAESGYSLQLQRERISAQILAKGWNLYKVYEDAGQSGGNLNRPAIQEMLNDIELGNIQAVVIYKLDRLSRKQRDTMYLIEDVFLRQNIELVSISESLDTSSPTGRAMIGMLSVFAQLERDTITERLSGGRKQKAKNGGYSGGNSAIGYVRKRGIKSLTVDENKISTVKRVFELRENTVYTLQQIADQLNREGHTTKQGASFRPTQVMRILNREELYKGLYKYSGITANGQHQAII